MILSVERVQLGILDLLPLYIKHSSENILSQVFNRVLIFHRKKPHLCVSSNFSSFLASIKYNTQTKFELTNKTKQY